MDKVGPDHLGQLYSLHNNFHAAIYRMHRKSILCPLPPGCCHHNIGSRAFLDGGASCDKQVDLVDVSPICFLPEVERVFFFCFHSSAFLAFSSAFLALSSAFLLISSCLCFFYFSFSLFLSCSSVCSYFFFSFSSSIASDEALVRSLACGNNLQVGVVLGFVTGQLIES